MSLPVTLLLNFFALTFNYYYYMEAFSLGK